jgi:hypothetical protein
VAGAKEFGREPSGSIKCEDMSGPKEGLCCMELVRMLVLED